MLTDFELARESRAGSLAAFEELVFRYERRVYGFVRNSCWDEHRAREITQDTFVRAFQRIHQYDGLHPFGAWLFAIARRKCVDHFRALAPVGGEPAPEDFDADDPSEQLARREEQANLWRLARRTLSRNQFQALWLRYAEDLPVVDIARVLGKTKTYVKVLLFRARRGLLRELEQPRRQPVPSTRADRLAVPAARPAITPAP